jgi:hypothetical protein
MYQVYCIYVFYQNIDATKKLNQALTHFFITHGHMPYAKKHNSISLTWYPHHHTVETLIHWNMYKPLGVVFWTIQCWSKCQSTCNESNYCWLWIYAINEVLYFSFSSHISQTVLICATQYSNWKNTNENPKTNTSLLTFQMLIICGIVYM